MLFIVAVNPMFVANAGIPYAVAFATAPALVFVAASFLAPLR